MDKLAKILDWSERISLTAAVYLRTDDYIEKCKLGKLVDEWSEEIEPIYDNFCKQKQKDMWVINNVQSENA